MRTFALIVGVLVIAYGGGCIILAGGYWLGWLLGGIPLLIGVLLVKAVVDNPRGKPFPMWATVLALIGLAIIAFLLLVVIALLGA